MPQFYKRRPFIILLILIILVIVFSIFASLQPDGMTMIEDFTGKLITPVQGFMYEIATSISNFFSSIGERRDLIDNYDKLKEEVIVLEQQQLEMDEALQENERLKELLDFKTSNPGFILEGVKVTGKNSGNWFNVITINKGSNDNVKEDMAVVTDKGLVGRVIEVGSTWAQVRTIIDSKSSVSALIQRTRDDGMVNGNNRLTYEDGLCTMTNLPLDLDVEIGDKVITSGLGGIFPKGIYIGEVIEVASEKRDMYTTVIVEPGADFKRLEEVLIISGENEGVIE